MPDKRQHAGKPTKQHTTVVQVQQEALFSGPIPPPHVIEHYAKIYPDAARIIFEMFEAQSKNRMERENLADQIRIRELELNEQALEESVAHNKRTQWQNFSFVMAGMFIGAGLVAAGFPTQGFFLVLVELAGLLGVTVYNRHLDIRLNSQKSPT